MTTIIPSSNSRRSFWFLHFPRSCLITPNCGAKRTNRSEVLDMGQSNTAGHSAPRIGRLVYFLAAVECTALRGRPYCWGRARHIGDNGATFPLFISSFTCLGNTLMNHLNGRRRVLLPNSLNVLALVSRADDENPRKTFRVFRLEAPRPCLLLGL